MTDKKDYEKPNLESLGNDKGELAEEDLDKVSGGTSGDGCSTGEGASGNCGQGRGSHRNCSVGSQVQPY